jgi:hypothetical protein
MATTATKLKIAKTKPAPHKILPVEYRCVHFWNSSTTSAFQTAILPLFGGIFFGAKSTRAKKPFLCHFLLQCPEALEIGSVMRKKEWGMFRHLSRHSSQKIFTFG